MWGLCNSCQDRIFRTPLSLGAPGTPRRRCLRLGSPLAGCRKEAAKSGIMNALAKAVANPRTPPFGELRLDGAAPVAFPSPNCLWPSALQLLHAQRFSLLSIQERLRCCSGSSELLALLQCPLLQRFERPDWPSRAAAAIRTCLLLLLQQHPKLQLLLSSLQGCRISYHDPLQLRLLRRMQEKEQHPCDGKGENDEGASSEAQQGDSPREPPLEPNLAGLLLMELCEALGPPVCK